MLNLGRMLSHFLPIFTALAALGCGGSGADGNVSTGQPGGSGGQSGGPGTGGAGTGGAAGAPRCTGDGTSITGVETPVPPCDVAAPLAYSALPANDKLPDPFLLADGTPVTTAAHWAQRRAEILTQVAEYELGPKPPKPSSVTGSLGGDTLTIDVTEGEGSISFAVTVSKPSGAGPFPAIISYGPASIPIPPGVATITFDNDDIAAQQDGSSRGQGKFYQLYGGSHGAGAMMAWAWGVSRIIDVLEATPEAGINPERVGVTGCSRNGKGALVAGAYDARIALTLPQESGSGGSACWRISDYQKSTGDNVQTLAQITGENVWFRSSFSQFNTSAAKLPFDHHMVAGLVAPRGLLMLENTDMVWLGSVSCFSCGSAARRIWDALGVTDNMGLSQAGHPDHCTFPAEQQPELTAYIDKFLLDQPAATGVLKTDGPFGFDAARWIDWDTPTTP